MGSRLDLGTSCVPTESCEGVRGKSFPPRFLAFLFLLDRDGIGPGVDDFGGAVVVVFDEVVEGGDWAGEAVGVGGGAGGGGVEGGGQGVSDGFGEVVAMMTVPSPATSMRAWAKAGAVLVGSRPASQPARGRVRSVPVASTRTKWPPSAASSWLLASRSSMP